MAQAKQRVTWLDIAKAITIFLVVFGHVLRGGTAQKIVFSFHVATFFLLSGMTCKTDNLKARIKNDFLRIMVPYYSFSILSIIIFRFLGDFAASRFSLDVDTSLWHNLVGMLYACPVNHYLKYNLPLWFLPCLFTTKMLYYVLCRLCRENQPQVFLCSLLLAALSAIYSRFIGTGLPFNLSVAAKMLVFFSLGRIIFSRLTLIRRRCPAMLSGILLLLATSVIAAVLPRIDYASDYFPNYLTFSATALMGSLGVCFISIGLCSNRAFEYVGKSTLSILVMHKFPVLLFQTVGPQKTILEKYDSIAGIAAAVAVSLFSIGLCLIADWLIRRYFPFLLGSFSGNHPQQHA